MAKKATKKIREAEELQPMVAEGAGAPVPAAQDPAAAQAAMPAEGAPVEEEIGEFVEPLDLETPDITSASGEANLTDEQVAEIESIKTKAEAEALVSTAEQIKDVLNQDAVADAMVTGDTAGSEIDLPAAPAAPSAEEEGEVMMQSAKYTSTELEMLKEYRANFNGTYTDDELVQKYREFVKDSVSFEDEAGEALEAREDFDDEVVAKSIKTDFSSDDASDFELNANPEDGEFDLDVEDFDFEIGEDFDTEDVEVEDALEVEDVEEEYVEDEEDSNLLNLIADFLDKYDIEDFDDLEDTKEEIEADFRKVNDIVDLVDVIKYEDPEEDSAEEDDLEEELVEEEEEVEEEVEVEEDEEVLLEKKLAARRRLLEKHRRHFLEEKAPKRIPCPRPTRDFEDEETISLSEAYSRERNKGQNTLSKNEKILAKKRDLSNFGEMDLYTKKDSLREEVETAAPVRKTNSSRLVERETKRPARKEKSYEMRPSRRELFAESVERAERETSRKEALTRLRKVREANSMENPRFKEALNKSSRISEERETVDPNSWKANKFIDKYNESVEFSFEDFLRNGFLG